MRNYLSPLLLLFCFTACAAPPQQSSSGLREALKTSPERFRTEKKEVNRPFLPVFSAVQDNANRCLNTSVTAAPVSDGQPKMIVRYRSYAKKTSSMSAEVVLQSYGRADKESPLQWNYVLVADIEAIAADRTRVTISGPTILFGDIFDAIFTWAAGKSRTCPSVP